MATKPTKESVIKEPVENYFKITFGYSDQLVIPHKQGMMILDAIKSAEVYKENFGSDQSDQIKSIDTMRMNVGVISRDTYAALKLETILQGKYEDE